MDFKYMYGKQSDQYSFTHIVDAELLAKVLSNPEMAALLASLAKTMK